MKHLNGEPSISLSNGQTVGGAIDFKGISLQEKSTHFISVVFGIVSAVLFLVVCILQIVPGIPVACSISLATIFILFLAVSVVAFTIHCLKIKKLQTGITDATSELHRAFLDTRLNLMRQWEPERFIKPVRYKEPEVKQILPKEDEQPAVEVVSEPTVAPKDVIGEISTEKKKEETPFVDLGVQFTRKSKLSEEDIENICVPNRLQRILDLFHSGIKYSSLEKHKRYKSHCRHALDKIAHVCDGLSALLDKIKKQEMPIISLTEVGTMFLPPIFSPNRHPILRITYNMKDALIDGDLGSFWLHSLLHDPKAAYPFLNLCEMVKYDEDLNLPYCKLLSFANLMFTGWCVSTEENMEGLVGSIQALPIDDEKKSQVVNLLVTGNFLGALYILHKDSDPEWQKFLTRQYKYINASYEFLLIDIELDPDMRRESAEGESCVSSDIEVEHKYEKSVQLFSKFAKLLPQFLILLFVLENEKLWDAKNDIKYFFEFTPPQSWAECVAIVKGAISVPLLQERLYSYLPYGASEAVSAMLSNMVFGLFSLGITTKNQVSDVSSELLKIPEDEAVKIVHARKILNKLLPKLFP
ncbi:CT214 family putative inclusion membrane protein [Chlamydia vaughanii]|uniref:CT214 family putative inclusion membrane protein n=1 Tax=Chlamydia vaughanii TaxID=3112552 RepID=UPI0032B1259E